MWAVLATLIVLLITLVVVYEKVFHTYWQKKGISIAPGGIPILGHLPRLILGERWTFVQTAYKKHKYEKIYGCYEITKPTLFVCEPETIKQVLVKEFDSFPDRREVSLTSSEEDSWINEMLSLINGEKWKRLRSTMSPTFSSGKMKHMFSIVQHHAKNLVIHCENQMEKENKVDVKKPFGMFTMDVIASTAFGIECKSLLKENPIFAKNAEKLFQATPIATIKFFIAFLFPRISKMLGVKFVNETWNFFKNVSTETLKQRRASGEKRGDFLDLLLEEQEKQKSNFDENVDYQITDKTILSESVLFLVAGYDTTANALSVTTYFLAKYPEVQNKLREELNGIFDDEGNIEYHELMEAKYLDACISEALRLAGAVPILERKCTKEFRLPDSNFTIPVGMMVEIPVWGLHRDPDYWEDPEEYNPDRFLPENKSKIVPFTYMPFGLGPRNCIAMRFALMETKICLSHLVRSNKISFAPGCGELEFENGGGVIRPKAGCVVVQLEKI